MSRKEKTKTYRLEILSALTGTFFPYTHRDGHPSLAFIESLARGQLRQGQAWRIVALPSGEILDEWSAA